MNNAGIQIYDQFGNLIIDGSTPILKFVADIPITTSGSTNVSGLIPTANTIIAAPLTTPEGNALPQLSVSGQTVSWAPQPGGYPMNIRLNVMAF